MFLNNTGLLVELEDSMDVQRKERERLVKELVVRMILWHNAHEIGDVSHKLIRWMHPSETTIGRGIRMEALLASGSKCVGMLQLFGRWDVKKWKNSTPAASYL